MNSRTSWITPRRIAIGAFALLISAWATLFVYLTLFFACDWTKNVYVWDNTIGQGHTDHPAEAASYTLLHFHATMHTWLSAAGIALMLSVVAAAIPTFLTFGLSTYLTGWPIWGPPDDDEPRKPQGCGYCCARACPMRS